MVIVGFLCDISIKKLKKILISDIGIKVWLRMKGFSIQFLYNYGQCNLIFLLVKFELILAMIDDFKSK